MSDIVERLREAAASLSEIYPDYAEAADEITRLRAENEKLRAALKPFKEAADDLEEGGKGSIYESSAAMSIDCDDLRAAAAALKETGDE